MVQRIQLQNVEEKDQKIVSVAFPSSGVPYFTFSTSTNLINYFNNEGSVDVKRKKNK